MLFWREVYQGLSLDEFNKRRSSLKENGIEYRYKSIRHDETPPLRGSARNMTGRVGEITNASCVYYLYVKKDKYDEVISMFGTI